MPELAICGSCGSMHKDRSSSTCAKCWRPRHRPYSQQRSETASFYASARWRKVRLMVLDRDGYQCVCGRATDLIVHHRTALTERPELALELTNLVTLCRKCHGRFEAHKRANDNATRTRAALSPVTLSQTLPSLPPAPSTALTRDARHTGAGACIQVRSAKSVVGIIPSSFDVQL